MKNENLDKYFDNIFNDIDPNIKLDFYQKEIVLDNSQYCLVVAGAGSGKTTTMAAKVKYLCEIKNIKPNEILMISYTNKAVIELRERINESFKLPVKISTFHALGLEIINKYGQKKKIINDNLDIVKKIINNPSKILKEKIVEFLILYLYENPLEIEFSKKEKFLNFLKKVEYKNLNNERMKNYIEVIVSNLLIINNIKYNYNKEVYCNKQNFLPSFTIILENKIIYINISVINFNFVSKTMIRKYINKKEKDKQKIVDKIIFIENHFDLDTFIKEMLNCGILIELNHIDEIYGKILCNKYKIKTLSNLISDFSNLSKTKGVNLESINKELLTIRNKKILEIINEVNIEYNLYLEKKGMIDFEMMIIEANRLLKSNLNIFLNYKYIIIDEYQDIANQRFELVKQLSEILNTKIIAVGDDWQSIFSFAGSDISLFMDFKNIFPNAIELKIINTYRNSQKLIDIAGKFVQKNKLQIRKKLVSPKKSVNPVIIKSYYKDKNQVLINVIEEIIENFGLKRNILIIGRFNFELNYILKNSSFKYTNQKIIYNDLINLDITFMSAHSSKGLGYDNVIIYNAESGMYGFPSEKSNDYVYSMINKSNNEIEFAEERRLFYVALTRTKNNTYIIIPKLNPSKFVIEISKYSNVKVDIDILLKKEIACPKCGYYLEVEELMGEKIYSCTNDKMLCQYKTCDLKNMEMLKKCKKCKVGYVIEKYNIKIKKNTKKCSENCILK